MPSILKTISENVDRFFHRYFTIHPKSATSMLPVGQFRHPAPSSGPAYIPPLSPASNISKNAYWQRDARRSSPSVWMLDNPALSSSPLLSASQTTSPIVSSSSTMIAPIPGRPHLYKPSESQPKASGYYPIHYIH